MTINALYDTETITPIIANRINSDISKAEKVKGNLRLSGKTIKSGELYIWNGKNYSLRGVK